MQTIKGVICMSFSRIGCSGAGTMTFSRDRPHCSITTGSTAGGITHTIGSWRRAEIRPKIQVIGMRVGEQHEGQRLQRCQVHLWLLGYSPAQPERV